jgi:hypothetical protein
VTGTARRVGARTRRLDGRGMAAVHLASLVLLATGFVAATAGVAGADPSPFCRPSLGTPSATEAYVGSNQYTVTLTVTSAMTCNAAIYKGSVTSVLYYNNNYGSTHAVDGTACSSNGKAGCSSTAHYQFTQPCADYLFITDSYGRLTGTWQQTSTSATNALSSGDGPSYEDYFTGGPAGCPL